MIPGLQGNTGGSELRVVAVRSVLVVDEAVPVRRKLLDILHRSGVPANEVLNAARADEALEIFARNHPSLVFCEFVENPSRGLDMILEMLTLDPQAKVVLITAEDPSSDVVRQAIRAGAFGIVRKPLRHEAIRQILTEIESEEGGIERFR